MQKKEDSSTFNKLLTQKFERSFLITLTLITCVLCFTPDLDLFLAKLYFSPTVGDHWPERSYPLWRFFYYAAPALSALICLPSIVIYILSFLKQEFLAYRKRALFVFLAFAIGPGILVNAIFKPYWGRPRPRQVVELGGQQAMQVFWKPGKSGSGYSFPCGHCSVGFALVSLYFINKKRRPKTAVSLFLATGVLGVSMGVSRMADGAHFFSDVLWSAIFVFSSSYYLYYHLLNLESEESDTHRAKLNRKKALVQGVALLTILGIATIMATPFHKNFKQDLGSQSIEIYIPSGSVEILPTEDSSVSFTGEARGFGWPSSTVSLLETQPGQWQISKLGFFSDLEQTYRISVNPRNTNLKLRLGKDAKMLGDQDPSLLEISIE